MTEQVKQVPVPIPAPILTPEQQIEQAAKEKKERRLKEHDAVRKIVEDAAKAHDDLGKKFLKEDAEEAAKAAEKK